MIGEILSDTTTAIVQFSATLRGLRSANRSRSKRWGVTTPEFDGLELSGEVGELNNIVKKMVRMRLGLAGGLMPNREHLREEFADVLIVLDRYADNMDIDLVGAIHEKFNRDSIKRGFPERLTIGDNNVVYSGPSITQDTKSASSTFRIVGYGDDGRSIWTSRGTICSSSRRIESTWERSISSICTTGDSDTQSNKGAGTTSITSSEKSADDWYVRQDATSEAHETLVETPSNPEASLEHSWCWATGTDAHGGHFSMHVCRICMVGGGKDRSRPESRFTCRGHP